MIALPSDRTGPRSVRPVSQIVFEITDSNAFEKGIELVVEWLNGPRRCKGKIPPTAKSGEPFELDVDHGSMPVEAAVFKDEKIEIWASRLQFPDMKVGQRIWSTEVSIARARGSTVFLTRLSNITLGADPPYLPSVPGVVTGVLANLSAQADNFQMREVAERIGAAEYDEFERLLLNPERRLPIVAIAEPMVGEPVFSSDTILRRVAGACHVVVLDHQAAWRMTRSLGKRFSVFDGASRLYLPGLDPIIDDPFRHPLSRPSESNGTYYANWLAQRLLSQGFVRPLAGLDQLRIAQVKARASSAARLVSSSVDELDGLRASVKSLQTSLSDLETQAKQDADAAQALLDEAADKADQISKDRDELASENDRLRSKIKGMNFGIEEVSLSTEPLTDYSKFEEWTEATLGSNIEVLSRAIRETEKRGTPEIMEKLQDCLLLLRDFYVPMKIEGGSEKQEAFLARCRELGVEERACFAQKGDIKSFPGYRVQRGSKRLWLDRHIKFGNGTDLRIMFRIYFCWDEDDQVLVLGHMPSHLDNNLTN